jgi:hypothetical protein
MQNTLPDNLKPLEREIGTYYRELPRLIAEGHEGRYTLIRGEELLSIWDTLEEAATAGHDRFGFERFMTQKIRSRDLEHLAPYFTAEARAGA